MVTSGAIAIFDILGYQSFLANNRIDAAQTVVQILRGIEQSMSAELVTIYSKANSQHRAQDLPRMLRWLVFSDTILIYTRLDQDETPKTISNRWNILHFACLLLWRRMFQHGLPLRGVIHNGEFLVVDTCFAGRAIVEAYQLAQDCDMSMCAYSPEAFEALVHQANEPLEDAMLWRYIATTIFSHPVPRKCGPSTPLHVMNPLAITLEDQRSCLNDDLPQLVRRSFAAHAKDIPESAEAKLRNTVQYLASSRAILKDPEESVYSMLRLRKKRPEQSPPPYSSPAAGSDSGEARRSTRVN